MQLQTQARTDIANPKEDNWVTLNPYGEVLQHVVGSNRIKEEDKTVNASLPPNQRGDLGTSRILPDFKSFDFEKMICWKKMPWAMNQGLFSLRYDLPGQSSINIVNWEKVMTL
ncbi:hypothetical protein GH714_039302 [Hevea brasiliensis]|uniref:Uncharacterized protein n=1 Tax=Hevea brasiliensis TaxID=3981 RepID=A0A6A6MR35_HEVBR|nr:hypothetical protein GH714_039302 [Hevea brasiliensis]